MSEAGTIASRTAAVVILFEPTAGMLANITSYTAQVAQVIAVDNTPEPDPGLVSELERMGVRRLWMGANRGIAAALNAGCRAATEAGFEWALTLDQDSTPAPDLVDKLALCCTGSPDVLLVAPVWQMEGGLEEELSPECREVDFALTSGNLLRLSAHDALGGFREDLFIDQVDTEFCLRARLRGWRIFQRRDAVLLHRQGRLEERRRPFRHFVTNYSPLRRYYMARNGLEVNRLYGRDFPEWTRGERHQWTVDIPKIVLSEDQKLAKLRNVLRGMFDYRARRFGSYEELHPPKHRRRARTDES